MSILATSEIRQRAARFAKEHAQDHYEMGQAQDFIREFCDVFGFSHRRLVTFEERVTTASGRRGRIDGFYPGKLLIEMKSRGADLAAAYVQARGYLPNLPEAEVPQYLLVCDFEHLHLYDLEAKTEPLCCALAELPAFIEHYLFLAGYETVAQADQIAVNEKAAQKIANLHDAMHESGYTGAHLERYLTRLLFCLFADDTDIFAYKGAFAELLINQTDLDGGNLDHQLKNLFEVLNTTPDKRPKNLPEVLANFPYINGSVFDGHLNACYFNSNARAILLDCTRFDWAKISPAIFGSLFQAIIHNDDEGEVGHRPAKSAKRRELGAHYTSEENILKVIEPLFLGRLKKEFNTLRRKKSQLIAFQHTLANIHVFDPACGCGNFLVVAYRELRRLELDVVLALQILKSKQGKQSLGLDAKEFDTLLCDVDQCHGIEVEPSAAHIATVALWLTDHQENRAAGLVLGGNYHRLPLNKRANIHCTNALSIDWDSIVAAKKCSFVIGNPPFIGAKMMSAAQRQDTQRVFESVENAGLLDFVCAWYVKANRYMQLNKSITCAFVSTNSISQGEQVGVLWSWLYSQGTHIHFAHKSFKWTNEARGKAAVHCIVIGFGLYAASRKTLFSYLGAQSQTFEQTVNNINPYLVDAPDVLLPRRSSPICKQAPDIGIGNKPIDNGNYLFSESEKKNFLKLEPAARPYFRRWMGAEELMHNKVRWCLWLGDCSPAQINAMPECKKRVVAVKNFRLNSKSLPTIKLAESPANFHVQNMPKNRYLALSKVSTEKRNYLPLAYLQSAVLSSDLLFVLRSANLYDFGILSSKLHNAWIRAVCGRLGSSIRYSRDIVYNNYPWPIAPAEKQRIAIEAAAQAVLDVRKQFEAESLGNLYDPLLTPPALVKAHRQLDRCVDAAYGYKKEAADMDDAPRVAFLFGLYQQLTAGTAPMAVVKKPRKTI